MRVIGRDEWGATAPQGSSMRLPVDLAFLHHSVTSPSANVHADMRTLERIGVQRFGRFSYSYAVHPSGVVLEGAGDTIGAHTGGRNSTSLGIVLIGNYEQWLVQHAAVMAVVELVRHLRDTGRLTSDSKLWGHRDVKSTACPGINAYRLLPQMRLMVDAPPHQPSIPEDDDMKPYLAQGSSATVWLIFPNGQDEKGVPTGEGLADCQRIYGEKIERVSDDFLRLHGIPV